MRLIATEITLPIKLIRLHLLLFRNISKPILAAGPFCCSQRPLHYRILIALEHHLSIHLLQSLQLLQSVLVSGTKVFLIRKTRQLARGALSSIWLTETTLLLLHCRLLLFEVISPVCQLVLLNLVSGGRLRPLVLISQSRELRLGLGNCWRTGELNLTTCRTCACSLPPSQSWLTLIQVIWSMYYIVFHPKSLRIGLLEFSPSLEALSLTSLN